jgi:type IV pilus assembly protein PilC
MFNPRIRTQSLVIVCRSLATMLDSGIPIGKAFDLAARQMSDSRCRGALLDISADLKRGRDVSEALQAQGHLFPETMIDLVGVGEQTGALPEILRSLAGHFENTIRLRRTFFSAIAWPAFQLVAAIFIIAALLCLLGWIADSSPGGKKVDVLGLGLYGTDGAIAWLGMTFGSMIGAYVLAAIIRRTFLGQKIFDRFLLHIPVLGPCMRAFALARFSWSFALTQQAGMSIEPSLRSSFKATTNGAFIAASPHVWAAVREGETLYQALAATGLFPLDFLHIVDVAETSGTVPEQLARLSPEFEAEAHRRLQTLASALAWLIWCVVAGFIIFLVFRIFMTMYLGPINEALKQVSARAIGSMRIS